MTKYHNLRSVQGVKMKKFFIHLGLLALIFYFTKFLVYLTSMILKLSYQDLLIDMALIMPISLFLYNEIFGDNND